MFTTMVLAASLVMAAPADGNQGKQQAFTPDEQRQALEALKTIAAQFEQQKTLAEKEPKKSMAEVADKALDFSVKYIGQAAAIIEKAAPHVWTVMVRQQYAKALGEIIMPFLMVLLIPFTAAIVRKFWRETDDYYIGDDEAGFRVAFTLVLPGVAAALFAVRFAYCLSDSIMYLINPEYYAIQDLVRLLLHPGSM